jgi:hypothetical protein
VSNQQKAELVIDNFGIQNFQVCHGQISPRDQCMPKVRSGLFKICDSATRPSSDSRNLETADRLESDNEPSEKQSISV